MMAVGGNNPAGAGGIVQSSWSQKATNSPSIAQVNDIALVEKNTPKTNKGSERNPFDTFMTISSNTNTT